MRINIAMDGPVGAGKSSIADAVAAKLGILHLDTGAMYRAVGYSVLEQGIDINDEAAVTAYAQDLPVDVEYTEHGQKTMVNGTDVTPFLREERVSMAASKVGTYGGVRRAMVRLQQALAQQHDMLVDGRDICLRVLPEAPVKIYLTASAEERARRRYLQLQEKGSTETFEEVLEDLKKRDAQDMNREVDPLRPTEDAVIVDSSDLDFDQTIDTILQIVRNVYHV